MVVECIEVEDTLNKVVEEHGRVSLYKEMDQTKLRKVTNVLILIHYSRDETEE